jgi:hypothetical protein
VAWVSGLYDGYASVAFSTIADAMTVKDFVGAQQQINLVGTMLWSAADSLACDDIMSLLTTTL